jgi:type II secretory pathway component PulK
MHRIFSPRFAQRVAYKAHPVSHGAILIVVMVALVVFATLCGVLVKLALVEQRQVRMQEWRVQAEWLAESGIERAAARLAASADYAGETWQVSTEETGSAAGVVRIDIERVDARPNLRVVRVQADYLRHGVRSARHSKHVSVEINQQSSETRP